jgi:hypothetical protein
VQKGMQHVAISIGIMHHAVISMGIMHNAVISIGIMQHTALAACLMGKCWHDLEPHFKFCYLCLYLHAHGAFK